jgi:hypothetical protein
MAFCKPSMCASNSDPCRTCRQSEEESFSILSLGRVRLEKFGIELYPEYAEIALERCRQAHALRREYESENPMTPSTPISAEALTAPLSDEVGGDVQMVSGAACS